MPDDPADAVRLVLGEEPPPLEPADLRALRAMIADRYAGPGRRRALARLDDLLAP